MANSIEHAVLKKLHEDFTAKFEDCLNHLFAEMEQKFDAALQRIFAMKDVDKLPESDEKRSCGGTIVLQTEAHDVFDENPIDKILDSKPIGGNDKEDVSPITACKVFDESTEPILESSPSINQVLGAQNESKNVEEYSSSSFSRNEVSFSFFNHFSYEAGKLFNDMDFQPIILGIESVEVIHQLFDKMPQPLVFALNHKMYIDKVYVPPLSPLFDYGPQNFDPGGVSWNILGGIIDQNGVNRDFDIMLGKLDDELWVGKMILFTFDPGGSSWTVNGCDAFEFSSDRQHHDQFYAFKASSVFGALILGEKMLDSGVWKGYLDGIPELVVREKILGSVVCWLTDLRYVAQGGSLYHMRYRHFRTNGVIHQGNVQRDEITLEQGKIVENTFVVIMLAKNKSSPAEGSAMSTTPANKVQRTYSFEFSRAGAKSKWVLGLLINYSMFSTQFMSCEEIMVNVSSTNISFMSKLEFAPQVFDPGSKSTSGQCHSIATFLAIFLGQCKTVISVTSIDIVFIFDPGGCGEPIWFWIEGVFCTLFSHSHEYLERCVWSHITSKHITILVDEMKRADTRNERVLQAILYDKLCCWKFLACDAINKRSNAFELRDDRLHDQFSAIMVNGICRQYNRGGGYWHCM